MGVLIDWLESKAPTRFHFDMGPAFIASIGHIFEGMLDGVQWALQSRYPDYAPGDALYYAGQDRQLVRGPSETDEQWRERLNTAWEAHVWSGTPDGLKNQLISVLPSNVGVEFVETYWRFAIVLIPSDQSWTPTPALVTSMKQVTAAFRPGHVVDDSCTLERSTSPKLWGRIDEASMTWDQIGLAGSEVVAWSNNYHEW